jgi:hypothetical protein
MRHTMRLELVDSDGGPVRVPTPDGEQALYVESTFEVGRPAGLKPGTPIDVPIAMNFPAMPIPPGGRYEWRLSIDGDAHEDWRVAFSTRPAAA